MFSENFLKFGSSVRHDLRMTLLEFGGQRSKVKVVVISSWLHILVSDSVFHNLATQESIIPLSNLNFKL